MIRILSTLLLSAAFLAFMTGAGLAQAAKPEHPTRTEHPKAGEKKLEHPKAGAKQAEHPKSEEKKPEHPQAAPKKSEHPK